jgi:hypothetical protein
MPSAHRTSRTIGETLGAKPGGQKGGVGVEQKNEWTAWTLGTRAPRRRNKGLGAESVWQPWRAERTLCCQGKEILECLYRIQANGSYHWSEMQGPETPQSTASEPGALGVLWEERHPMNFLDGRERIWIYCGEWDIFGVFWGESQIHLGYSVYRCQNIHFKHCH